MNCKRRMNAERLKIERVVTMLDCEKIYKLSRFSCLADFTGSEEDGLEIVEYIVRNIRSNESMPMVIWKTLAIGRILGIREERKRNATRKDVRK